MNEEECIDQQDAELELISAAYLGDATIINGGGTASEHCREVRTMLVGGVYLHVQMPSSYPNTPLAASLLSSDWIFELDVINAQISSYIQLQFENRSLNCMDVMSFAKDLVENVYKSSRTVDISAFVSSDDDAYDSVDNPQGLVLSSPLSPSVATVAISQPQPTLKYESKLVRILIYFHHIKSIYKKKEIVSQAIDLELGGVWKEGFPGVVIVEGMGDNVYQYVRRLQQLRWQHMVVRGEEVVEVEFDHPEKKKSDVSNTSMSSKEVAFTQEAVAMNRKFDPGMVEVGSMSDLGQYCKSRDVHELFMSITRKNS